MSDEAVFRIKQGGQTVAKVEGPAREAEAEIWHYAMQYRADGPLTIERKVANATGKGSWWKRHAAFEQWSLK